MFCVTGYHIAWIPTRGASAREHLFDDVVSTLHTLRTTYPNACIGTITHGLGSAAGAGLGDYFDFEISAGGTFIWLFWLFLVIFGYFWQFPYGQLVTDAVFCLPLTAIFPRARRRHQVPRDAPQPRVGRHRATRQATFRVRVGRHHVPAAPAHRASSRHAGYNRVDVFAIRRCVSFDLRTGN